MSRRGLLLVVGVTAALGTGLKVASRQFRRRYGRPLRRPLPATPVPSDAVDVTIVAADGATLRGWLRHAPAASPDGTQQAGPAAVVVHGWGGSARDMLPLSEPLLADGLHVLLLDARGHGRSGEADLVSMPAIAEDVSAALAWLRARPEVDPSRIVLVGHSVGAGACLFVAAGDPKIAAVVSLASMADPREFMSDRLRHRLPGPLTALALRYVEHAVGHRFTEFAPVHTISRFHAPVLLLHGERDTTVPVSDAHRLHARAPEHSTLVILRNADHNSVEALDGEQQTVQDFLRRAGVTPAAR